MIATDEEIEERVEELRADPRIAKWIKRFLAVARDLPEGIEVFCESGTAHVMAMPSDKHEGYETEQGGMDQRAIIASSDGDNSRWDGGGW